MLSSWSGDNPSLEIALVLIAVNFPVAIAMTLLLLFLRKKLGLAKGAALSVTGGFMLFSTTLNYVHTGMAYNLGLTLQLAALLLVLHSAAGAPHKNICAALGGGALALSFAAWAPYILTVPAVLLAGWFGEPACGEDATLWRLSNARLIAVAAAATAVMSSLVFGIAAGLTV